MDQIQFLPWNIGAENSGMQTLGIPRTAATEEVDKVELLSTSEGTRLLYLSGGSDVLVVDLDGEVRVSMSEGINGTIQRSWPGPEEGTSLVATQGRCQLSLRLIEF